MCNRPASPAVEKRARFNKAKLAQVIVEVEVLGHELSCLAPLPGVASRTKASCKFRLPWQPEALGYRAPPMQRRYRVDQVDGTYAHVQTVSCAIGVCWNNAREIFGDAFDAPSAH